jgi:oligopeptide/dipeptide ABC transporter ATP-binding protein
VKAPSEVKNEIVLAAVGLTKHFPVKGGFLQRAVAKVHAVDGVSLAIHRGETVALVGESGCGKTTLGRLLLRLIEPTNGDVLFNVPGKAFDSVFAGGPSGSPSEEALLEEYSITRIPRRQVKPIRRYMQPVFQDPFTSLDPRMLVKDIVAEPILINRLTTKEEAEDRAAALIREVGLRPEHLYRFPHEFSGGQRQRIAVARALSPDPEFLLLDEPTSALDVSVQAQILNLLKDIQTRQGLTYLLITHNLSVVKQMADRVDVMYLGKIVEESPTAELFEHPLHPYTKALLAAVPVPDPKRKRDRIVLSGDVPSPIDPPAGCRFHTRCPVAFEQCGWNPADLADMATYLFDSSRNAAVGDLPPLKDVQLSESVLRLDFDGAATEAHRKEIEGVVESHRAGPKGPMFQAIERVGLEKGSVSLQFLTPREPPLLEVSAAHRVACFLFPDQGTRDPT